MSSKTFEKASASFSSDAERKPVFRKAGILGSGNMGSRIAAHFANAGVPVVLLDLPSPGNDRSRIAAAALQSLIAAKPAAFYSREAASLITVGNFDDHLDLLRDCDWIVEAVAENLDIKRSLLSRVASVRRADAIVTTNTSGLPIRQIAEGMDESFRRHWFGTHFFNPPRYMRLLEVIAGPDSNPALLAAMRDFASIRLGKTIVDANDTPNFVANRIGIFAILNTIRVMQAMDLTIEEVDALTGAALGWPKTGTLRLSDLVGIDVLANIAQNFFSRVRDERADLAVPPLLTTMLERQWLGDKTKGGFYKKTRGPAGEEVRLGLDWKTLEYRPSDSAKFSAIDSARKAGSLEERLRLLLSGDAATDRAAAFYWQILPDIWNYSAHRIGEVASDLASIDRAMRTGFNWVLGPFEMWDAVGVPASIARMEADGLPVAPAAAKLLAAGFTTWYRDVASGRSYFDPSSASYRPLVVPDGVLNVTMARRSHGVVKENPAASLIDLGDGVACLEFHTKMNAIGTDISSLVEETFNPGSSAVANFDAFVIANDGDNFSAGANLMEFLVAIQGGRWNEIDVIIHSFQKMTQAVKFCPRPIVAAPFNLTLGGGAEVCMQAAVRQAHAELYMGLVESGVGLIPGGGGCKEILLQAVEAAASTRNPGNSVESAVLLDTLRKRFESVVLAKISGSAAEARELGFLRSEDGITLNRDRLLADAKLRARALAEAGYRAPQPRVDIPAPGESVLATLKLGVRLMREAESISDHDVTVANWLAYILCGGPLSPGTLVSEQYLLDLEREAFLSLCREKKTAERIAHTLKTGKPLKN